MTNDGWMKMMKNDYDEMTDGWMKWMKLSDGWNGKRWWQSDGWMKWKAMMDGMENGDDEVMDG